MAVLVETTLGDFVIDLFVKERPRSKFLFIIKYLARGRLKTHLF